MSTVVHRRFNPLLREWVLVSPRRGERPWQGHVEPAAPPSPPAFDADCYLCPGNRRAHGALTPAYSSTCVFDNDFPALHPPDAAPHAAEAHPLLRRQPESGLCRVLCYSPRHDLTLARLAPAGVRAVVDAWCAQTAELAARPGIGYVMVFENRGAMMGASNPHPHGQIWATARLPNQPARERLGFAAYRRSHGGCLLCDYVALELARGERMVAANASFAAVVPYWAVWPFEILIVSRRHCAALPDLDDAGRAGLADILRRVTIRYDNLFACPFPYSMGFHQQTGAREAHLHAHLLPPLLRSARIRKFVVGYELLATPQRDLTAETAAARLREQPETHYLELEEAAP